MNTSCENDNNDDNNDTRTGIGIHDNTYIGYLNSDNSNRHIASRPIESRTTAYNK